MRAADGTQTQGSGGDPRQPCQPRRDDALRRHLHGLRRRYPPPAASTRPRRTLTDGAWKLTKNQGMADDQPNPEAMARTAQLELPTDLTAARIRDSFGKPEAVPVWQLPAFIRGLERAGFFGAAPQGLVPDGTGPALLLAAMVAIAAVFTMRHMRGRRTGIWFAPLVAGSGCSSCATLRRFWGQWRHSPALAGWPSDRSLFLPLGPCCDWRTDDGARVQARSGAATGRAADRAPHGRTACAAAASRGASGRRPAAQPSGAKPDRRGQTLPNYDTPDPFFQAAGRPGAGPDREPERPDPAMPTARHRGRAPPRGRRPQQPSRCRSATARAGNGQTPATLLADNVTLGADNRLIASGGVVIWHKGARLVASRVIYDQKTGGATIEGRST